MGKPIAGVYKLPFGTSGIIINGAKLEDGTLIKNLRIVKQRSNTRFDLLDVNNNTIHKFLTITGVDRDFSVLDPTLDDDEVLAEIAPGTFYIRVLDQNDDSIGYCLKLYENLVHMSNDKTFYIENYDSFFAQMPVPSDPVYDPDGAQVSFHKVGKPNELMVGSGNSNKEMVTATDGIIEIAMAARLWQPSGTGTYNPMVTPVDSTYTIKMDKAKNQEYTLPFSIGIKSPEFIGKITDLYGVTMTYYGNNQGKMTDNYISWRLELIDGKYVMKDYRYGRDITDSAVNPQLTAIQNIERYKFFDDYLDIAPPAGEVPTGLYVGTIVARNLITGKVLELKVMLDASYL